MINDTAFSSKQNFWDFIYTSQYNECFRIRNLYLSNPCLFIKLLSTININMDYVLYVKQWIEEFEEKEILSIFNKLSLVSNELNTYLIHFFTKEIDLLGRYFNFDNKMIISSNIYKIYLKLLKIVLNNFIVFFSNNLNQVFPLFVNIGTIEYCKFINIYTIHFYYKYIFTIATKSIRDMIVFLLRVEDTIPKWLEKLFIKLLTNNIDKVREFKKAMTSFVKDINFEDRSAMIVFINII